MHKTAVVATRCRNCIVYIFNNEIVRVAWQKALQNIWGLQYVIHCPLSPHVIDLLPGDVVFSKRSLEYFITGYSNKNKMVSIVLDHQYAMYFGWVHTCQAIT